MIKISERKKRAFVQGVPNVPSLTYRKKCQKSQTRLQIIINIDN